MCRLANFAAAFAVFLLCTVANAASIVVTAPGNPIGYIPLSSFLIQPIAGFGDNTTINQNTPAFQYAGQTWNQIGIASNGFLVVGGSADPGAQSVNTVLPSSGAPANILAPFWTDLDPGAAGAIRSGVLTDGADSWFVVDWAGVQNLSDNTLDSFEVWIGVTGDAHPGEDITFAYGAIGKGDANHLTVGAQDISGSVGDAYYFDGAGTLPLSNTDLRVTTSGFPVPEPATLALLGLGFSGMGLAKRRVLN